MSTLHLVPSDLRERYLVKEWRNAAGVLALPVQTNGRTCKKCCAAFAC